VHLFVPESMQAEAPLDDNTLTLAGRHLRATPRISPGIAEDLDYKI